MAIKRKDMPLSSFDGRYKALILAGCKDRIEIKQTSRKDAQRLRNLLTTYRARMKDEWRGKDDSQWEPLYGAIIGVSGDGYSTVIRPRAQEAEHLLQNINIADVPSPAPLEAPETILEHDPLAEFDPPSEPSKD